MKKRAAVGDDIFNSVHNRTQEMNPINCSQLVQKSSSIDKKKLSFITPQAMKRSLNRIPPR